MVCSLLCLGCSWNLELEDVSHIGPKIPAVSVFVDTEDADTMELRQLGQEDAQQGGGIDDEVYGVIFGIKAGQDVASEKETYCVSHTGLEKNTQPVSLYTSLVVLIFFMQHHQCARGFT